MGVKQDALAGELGLRRLTISSLEQKEAPDKYILAKVARALIVPAEAIRNFDDQSIPGIVKIRSQIMIMAL